MDSEIKVMLSSLLEGQQMLQARMSTMESEMKALGSEMGSLRADVDGLKSDVGSLKSDVGSLKDELDAFRGEMAAFRAETDQRFSTLESKLDHLAEKWMEDDWEIYRLKRK